MLHLELASLTGPVTVTVAYMVLWYYLLLGLQRGAKYRLAAEYQARDQAFDRYFGQDPQMLAVDRVVTNTQEQMVPFLVALWLSAVLFSPSLATTLGALYVLLRAGYPVLMGRRLERLQPKRVYWVTIPCYAIVWTLLGTALVAVWSAGLPIA